MDKTQTAPTPPTHRARLTDEIKSRGRVKSLFALAIDLSIPYPKANELVRQLERAGQVNVERPAPGQPLVITWTGGDQ